MYDGGTNSKFVLLVDDDKHLIRLMTLLLNEAGIHLISARSLSDLQSKIAEVLKCETAILDINLGPDQPTGVDVYLWLKKEEFAGAIIFFTGHARWHPEVIRASELPGVRVVEKPTEISEFLRLVEAV